MWSSESCSSAKTVVAPTTRKSTPTAVPSVDWPLLAHVVEQRRPMACGAVGAQQQAHLLQDLGARGVDAEHRAGHRNRDQQQRRQREQRVVGQRRAHAGRAVVDPGHRRGAQQRAQRPQVRTQCAVFSHATPPGLESLPAVPSCCSCCAGPSVHALAPVAQRRAPRVRAGGVLRPGAARRHMADPSATLAAAPRRRVCCADRITSEHFLRCGGLPGRRDSTPARLLPPAHDELPATALRA